MTHSVRLYGALAALALAAACSESPLAPTPGADTSVSAARNAGSPNAAPAAVPAAVPATPTSVTVVGCDGTSVALTADEKSAVDLHDAQRRSKGLASFCVSATLTAAARAHSSEMLAQSYFAHNSYDGTSFGVRLTGFGYTPFRALAENIAWGSGTLGAPDRIFTSWMNSTGHRTNIENGALREIGVGVAAGTYQRYGNARMYTVDFGTR